MSKVACISARQNLRRRTTKRHMASFAPSSIKLIYFNGRGVVEAIRCMLTASGTAFEDFRYPISSSFEKPEFDADKVSLVVFSYPRPSDR